MNSKVDLSRDILLITFTGEVIMDPVVIKGNYQFDVKVHNGLDGIIRILLIGDAKRNIPQKGDFVRMTNGNGFWAAKKDTEDSILYCGTRDPRMFTIIPYDDGEVNVDEVLGL